MAAVGARARVELHDTGARRERPIQIARLQGCRGGAALIDPPFVVGRHGDRYAVELEPPRHMARDRCQGAFALGREQDVPGQIEEPRQLVAAVERLLRTRLR